ncbi:transmembrane proteins 14C-domain-containing protein [Aspergillus unguis]
MAEHPSFTLAALLSAGGVAGYLKTQSRPSLIAGLGLGASYAFSGYLLKGNKDYGAELALGNSIALLGAGVSRSVKTKGKAPVPLGLAAAGLLATFYYQKKFREFRWGV